MFCVCLQSIQGPRDEILVAFFSKDLKTASPEEKDLVAAVAAQDADAVQEALTHVSSLAARPAWQHALCFVWAWPDTWTTLLL
jgi:hypothetical protein